MSGEELARVALGELAEGKATRVEGGPHGICLVRVGDRVYALADRCSHAEVRLSEGDVDETEPSVECWKHGSAFRLEDGCPLSLPATQPVAAYVTRIEGAEVVVEEP